MTSRLNHDLIEWHGASSKGKELPDFLTSDDPWFRPVDLQWGPDGALYVADFYNRIIGHYEVPLDHPGRDRERGRIWRVVYKGGATAGNADVAARSAVLLSDMEGLVRELGSTNPTRRSLALNDIVDRLGKNALSALRAALASPVNSFQKAGALHALVRVGGLDAPVLAASISDRDPLVRSHALRIAAQSSLPALHAVLAALTDEDAIVRRVAAEALAAHPTAEGFAALLALLRTTDKADDHLVYSTRVALREHLRDPGVVNALKVDALAREDLKAVLDIMPAVSGEHAALLRLELFEKLDVAAADLAGQLPSIARNAPPGRLDGVVALARRKLPDDAAALAGILEALDSRGAEPPAALREWAASLVPVLLAGKSAAWSFEPGAAVGKNPWAIQERHCADGQAAQVMSSIVGGEALTGTLRSAPFAAPEKLRFYLCGHDGFPGKPAGGKNFVRLVDATDGRVFREAAPPRNDVAQRIEWDLSGLRGRSVRFEATDGDNARAYAWLAFGRFKPDLPELALDGAARSPRAVAAELAARFKMTGHRGALLTMFKDRNTDAESRAAAARALVAFWNVTPPVSAVPAGGTPAGRAVETTALRSALASADEPDALRTQVAIALGSITSPGVCQMVADAMPSASARLQQGFATALSANRCGTLVLITAIENGKASPAILRDKATVDRLRAAAKDDELKRLDALLAKLPPANVEADRLIAARRAAFDPAMADVARGAAVFKTHCAVCHQVGQVGALVGPQLDGIGNRGLDRILEDILDPNRNVDRAFRMSIVTLNDGSIAAGLFRREEGARLILADVTGREQSVPLGSVKKREEQDTSLMPAAFGQVIPAVDFDDLLAFLLVQRATR
jgi:putative heme-binding domain-containing protein